jgi:hypothetical protein
MKGLSDDGICRGPGSTSEKPSIHEEFQGQQETIKQLNLVVNWFQELKRLVAKE